MNLERVVGLKIPHVEHSYGVRDTMLYALGLGYGSNPGDRSDLQFVYEQGKKPLQVVPSFCVVLAHPGFWVREPSLAIDWIKVLHGEHAFEVHRPLAPAGRVRGEFAIVAVEDKGPDKCAIVHQQKTLFDVATGDLLATVRTVLFCRGDGGCGSFGAAPEGLLPAPDGVAERSKTIATLPQSGLLYRLSGDYNPIHVDPDAAEKAGLGRPILHGLCTLGIAVRAAVDELAAGSPERLRSVTARFSKPVYPGETIRTDFHGHGDTVRFRARVLERDAVVLDRGTVTLTD